MTGGSVVCFSVSVITTDPLPLHTPKSVTKMEVASKLARFPPTASGKTPAPATGLFSTTATPPIPAEGQVRKAQNRIK
jgi:hypothetical protein